MENRGRRPSLRFSLKQEPSDLTSSGNGYLPVGVDNSLKVRIADSAPKPSDDGEATRDTGEFFSVVVTRGGEELERYDRLTMNPQVETAVADYVATALEASEYTIVTDISRSSSPLSRRPANGLYEISPPPLAPRPETFPREVEGVRDDRTGVRGLFEIDEIAILAFPDLMRIYEAGLMSIAQIHGVMEMMVSMCEGAAAGDIPNPPNRTIVLDLPPDRVKPQDVSEWLTEEFARRSQFAAVYYPWLYVPNPRSQGRPIAVPPPCGYVTGVWARTDETRGVVGLAYDCNFREQELLNPQGINCIRTFPNRGIRIWGARALVEPEITEWRYINVRRLMSYIEKSVEVGTQWAVFEPNDEDFWSRITRTVTNFLTDLWRQGALMGGSPREAFYVKCDDELTPDRGSGRRAGSPGGIRLSSPPTRASRCR